MLFPFSGKRGTNHKNQAVIYTKRRDRPLQRKKSFLVVCALAVFVAEAGAQNIRRDKAGSPTEGMKISPVFNLGRQLEFRPEPVQALTPPTGSVLRKPVPGFPGWSVLPGRALLPARQAESGTSFHPPADN